MELSNGYRNIAIRIENARANLIDNVAELGNVDRATATNVADFYIAHKFVKLDAVGGRYLAKNGAIFDAGNIAAVSKGIK